METLRARQAPTAGLSASGLRRAALTGEYERIARGIYRASDAEPASWEWIEAAIRRPDATICLTSALAHHDLTDEIPEALDIAIPRGSRIPASEGGALAWHVFDRATFGLGRTTIGIPGSELEIGIYSAERCIADAFRLRNRVGYELVKRLEGVLGCPREFVCDHLDHQTNASHLDHLPAFFSTSEILSLALLAKSENSSRVCWS